MEPSGCLQHGSTLGAVGGLGGRGRRVQTCRHSPSESIPKCVQSRCTSLQSGFSVLRPDLHTVAWTFLSPAPHLRCSSPLPVSGGRNLLYYGARNRQAQVTYGQAICSHSACLDRAASQPHCQPLLSPVLASASLSRPRGSSPSQPPAPRKPGAICWFQI